MRPGILVVKGGGGGAVNRGRGTKIKLNIKQWRCLECPYCSLCKTYLRNLGYSSGRSLLARCYFVFIQR